ncbi:MAG: hypothetical protein Kow006_09970 [Gammaproteobacteria bacterium]
MIVSKLTGMRDDKQLSAYFYVADSGIHGKGLFAKRRIPEGSYLGTYDGPEVTDNGDHVLWAQDENDDWIGRDGQNMLRYLNHSKRPQAEFEGFDLYALRDIEPHEEITIDYGDDLPGDGWPDD